MPINLPLIEPFKFQQVNTGLRPGSGSGDLLSDAFQKMNDNFNIVAQHLSERISSDRTYFVSASGSNTNSGLSEEYPLATVTKALDLIENLDAKNSTIVIQLLPGSYSEKVIVATKSNSPENSPKIILRGNTLDPTTVEFSLNFDQQYCILTQNGAQVLVEGVSFISNQATSNGNNTSLPCGYLQASTMSTLYFKQCYFGEIPITHQGAHISADRFGVVEIVGDYRVLGGARYHLLATNNSWISSRYLTSITSVPVTFASYISFLKAQWSSSINLPVSSQILYTGSAAGNISERDITSKLEFSGNLPGGLTNSIITSTSLGVAYTEAPEVTSSDTRVPTTNWVQVLVNTKFSELAALISSLTGPIEEFGVLPVGALVPFAGLTAPNGFLLCQGQSLSRTLYATLFNVIGTLYGEGDGSTTFNLPDTRGRTLFSVNPTNNNAPCSTVYPIGFKGGKEQQRLTIDQLPRHGHAIEIMGHTHGVVDKGHIHPILDAPHKHNIGVRSNNEDVTNLQSVLSNIVNASTTYGTVETEETFSGITSTLSAPTGVKINKAYESATIKETGGNSLVNTMPPFITVNFIIKY